MALYCVVKLAIACEMKSKTCYYRCCSTGTLITLVYATIYVKCNVAYKYT